MWLGPPGGQSPARSLNSPPTPTITRPPSPQQMALEHRGQEEGPGWPEARRPDSAGGRAHSGAPAARGGGEFTGRRLHQQEERETEAGTREGCSVNPRSIWKAEGTAGERKAQQAPRHRVRDGAARPRTAHTALRTQRSRIGPTDGKAAGRASAQMRGFQPSLKAPDHGEEAVRAIGGRGSAESGLRREGTSVRSPPARGRDCR